jgi:hypothetical protein
MEVILPRLCETYVEDLVRLEGSLVFVLLFLWSLPHLSLFSLPSSFISLVLHDYMNLEKLDDFLVLENRLNSHSPYYTDTFILALGLQTKRRIKLAVELETPTVTCPFV